MAGPDEDSHQVPKRTANHLLRLTAHGLKPHMPSLVLTCVPTHVPVAIGEGNCGAAPQGEAATISNNVRASRTSRIRFGGLPLQGVARPQMVLPGATLWGDANARFGGLPLSGVARPQMVLPSATLWGGACSTT